MPEPLKVYEGAVDPGWIDYNGHLNDGYYAVLFSRGTDGLMDYIGVDQDYRDRTRQTLYTLTMKLDFLAEVGADTGLYVTAQMLAADSKKYHAFLRMHRLGDAALVATCETVMLHVDQAAGPAAAAFPEAVATRVQALSADHAALPWPQTASQPIALKRKG